MIGPKWGEGRILALGLPAAATPADCRNFPPGSPRYLRHAISGRTKARFTTWMSLMAVWCRFPMHWRRWQSTFHHRHGWLSRRRHGAGHRSQQWL